MTATLEHVTLGDVHVAGGDIELNCLGVGSGVVFAAFDPISKIGACAHLILPNAPATYDRSRPCKYVNTGIGDVIRRMHQLGADPKNICTALVGGASLMSTTDCSSFDLGNRNVEAAHEAIAELGIKCNAQDVGGQSGRNVSLTTSDGVVRVRSCAQPDRVLCKLRG